MTLARFKRATIAAAFLGLAAAASGTQAAIINDMLQGGTNEFQDTDAERILAADGSVVTSGSFVVGQVIQAILRFDTVNSNAIAVAHPAPYQLTAFSELLIAAITDTTGGACTGADTTCVLHFGASGNLGANVLASIYENNNNVIPSMFSKAPALGIADTTAAPKIADLGFGEADDFWFATFANVADPIGLLATLSASSPQVANGNFGLSFVSNPGSIPFLANEMVGADGNLHDVIGNASAYGRSPGVNTGWLLSSNTLAQFRVPEPGSLGLMGLVLLGVGFFTRRRG